MEVPLPDAPARLPSAPGRRRPAALLAVLLAGAAALTPAACRRAPAPPADAPPAGFSRAANEAAYLAPPRPIAASSVRQGQLHILGQAAPRAHIELASADGARLATTADARGDWSVRLPADTLRLYAISAVQPGRAGTPARIMHAEGALLITPVPSASAVVVRAGYAALPLQASSDVGLATVDYDPGGVVATAGFAAPRAQLTLMVDGGPAAAGQADEHGLYALIAANRRLALGPHELDIRTADGEVRRRVTLEPPVPLTAPYQAWLTPDGWRVEWALNGGGVQTTLILTR